MKAVLYARVSSREQEREGHSIPAQIRLIEEYAAKHGIKIVERFIEAESAKHSGREQFSQMLDFINDATEPYYLLVEKTDRLTRNFYDEVAIDTLIKNKGLEVHLVKEGDILSRDTKSHTKLMHNIKTVLATYYIDNLSEEIRKGQKQKLLEGGWSWKAPYGYQMVNKQLVIDQSTAPFVVEAFKLYATGMYSLEVCAQSLFDEGYIYRPNRPVISRAGLQKLLMNRIYIGELEVKGEIYQGNHHPLIGKEFWNMVQKAFKKDAKPDSYKKQDFFYRGILKCGECGSLLSGELKKGKYVYYRCTDKKKSCSQGYINEIKLDEAVETLVPRIQFSNELKEILLECYAEADALMEATSDEALATIDRKTKSLKGYLKQSYQDKLQGFITEDMWMELKADYEVQLEVLERRRGNVSKAELKYYDMVLLLSELGKNFQQQWSSAPRDEKRYFVNFISPNFIVKDGKADIELHEPFATLAQYGSCKEWWSIGDSNS